MQAHRCSGFWLAIAAWLTAELAWSPGSRAADWIGAWGASPSGTTKTESFVGETVRQIIHLNGGGRAVRLRLGNALSGDRLILGGVRIARPGTAPGTIAPETDQPVTVAGRPIIAVPPYATVLSDPVRLPVDSGTDLSVSLFVAASRGPTTHELGSDTALVAPGDQTRSVSLDGATTRDTRIVLSGVDVETVAAAGTPPAGTIVALGDSITDGLRSTTDLDRRWPDVLAHRLRIAPGLGSLGVVNAGISGNRLLRDTNGPNGLSRLPRDVLALPSLRVICVLEGINDIGGGATSSDPALRVTAADIVAAYGQIIAQGHERGAKVLIGTLTPFSGAGIAEQVRSQVNAWIRAKDGFEGVLDFDAAIRDPRKPTQLLARYDSGDHIHPNDDGYAAMADAVDLDLLR